MKKIFSLIAVVALISLSSCKNECTCTTTATGDGAELIPASTITAEVDGKCTDGNSTSTVGGLTLKTVCK